MECQTQRLRVCLRTGSTSSSANAAVFWLQTDYQKPFEYYKTTRSDDTLIALREFRNSRPQPTLQHRPRSYNHENRPISSTQDGSRRSGRASTFPRVPIEVVSMLPREDGRRLCHKYLSKVGCPVSDCSRGHFRPRSLPQYAKSVIDERWQGLASQFSDL